MIRDRRNPSEALSRCLDAAFHAPDFALWRACEAMALADVPMPPPLLDLGCGDGWFGAELFESVDVGMDLQHQQVRKAAGVGLYRGLCVANACRMPFASGSFATVFSNCVMEHITPLEEALAEVGRVLRPGGRFVFSVPSGHFDEYLFFPGFLQRLGMSGRGAAYARALNHESAHHNLMAPERWGQALRAGGLELAEVRYYMPRAMEGLWDLSGWLYRFGPRVAGKSLCLSTVAYRIPALRRLTDPLYHRLFTRIGALCEEGVEGGGFVAVARRAGGAAEEQCQSR